ncbi:kinase/pyrophosphorylase [Halobacteriovorax sp. GB3]|uniref:pyruvate, water dikinase regulatory protein n=1 Tax=Halobacteriovorax sp. GB3 TaxID=2719615 RepID=UPI0023601F5C|nr:pyruvate, water dikinase regulatory protein [Halobacteriovorax sp. GB3]MDD0853920.1 kinase/pyrophosphorylase [Halobacteriovorax sp. GB3]
MSPLTKRLKIIIISDGTGETATAISRAIMTQFPERDVYFTRYKNVRSKDQITAIFDEAAIHHDLIIYTVVTSELREFIGEQARVKHVRALDLIGPALTTFANYFEQEPKAEPGLLHAVNDDYYKRVEAMEFTLNHDDGRNLASLHLADVILVGISRTSKTPLSVYLCQHGLKVVNIPIISNQPLPVELREVDQRKIFALTIDPDALMGIRRNRLTRLGAQNHTGDYADHMKVIEEIEWANELFAENKRWPVFNVTDKALEETAADIMKLINMRKNNIFKQLKREQKED